MLVLLVDGALCSVDSIYQDNTEMEICIAKCCNVLRIIGVAERIDPPLKTALLHVRSTLRKQGEISRVPSYAHSLLTDEQQGF